MAKKKTFENIISNLLGEPVSNICHAFYDQYVEANVKFRSRAGMKTLIIRRQLGKCCKWCADLAGIYTPENAPDDIYKRHDNCKCMVTYKDENGYTDVWSKREFQKERDARNALETEISVKRGRSRTLRYSFIEKESSDRKYLEKIGFVRRSKLLNYNRKNGILNIEIDELVPCLKDVKTGEIVKTEAFKVIDRSSLKKYSEKTGWNTNWYDLSKNNEIYAVCVKGSDEIQGLIAFHYDKEAGGMYLNWASAAPWNVKEHTGGTQKYSGVGGHLFAIAAEKTLEMDPKTGWMYGFAKNKRLVDHYKKEFFAEHAPYFHPNQIIIDTPGLYQLLEKYNYEWK